MVQGSILHPSRSSKQWWPVCAWNRKRRIFPAIDPIASGTRREDLLLDPQEAPVIWAVRRILANMNNTERAMDMLIKSLKQTDDNKEFLMRTAKKGQGATTSRDTTLM